jgi:hypothetical protein
VATTPPFSARSSDLTSATPYSIGRGRRHLLPIVSFSRSVGPGSTQMDGTFFPGYRSNLQSRRHRHLKSIPRRPGRQSRAASTHAGRRRPGPTNRSLPATGDGRPRGSDPQPRVNREPCFVDACPRRSPSHTLHSMRKVVVLGAVVLAAVSLAWGGGPRSSNDPERDRYSVAVSIRRSVRAMEPGPRGARRSDG